MEVQLTITLQIELNDGTPDAISGDPLEDRMRSSALEAVGRALKFAEDNGFIHEMEDIACVGVVSVELIPTAVDGHGVSV